VSDETGLRRALEAGSITVYCGYDATATSLHVGNLVSIMALAHLQRAGNRVIAIVGGGTTMIGDPSGKTAARPFMAHGEIERNLAGIRRQFDRYLSFDDGRALLLNNADWLLRLGYIEFIRDVGRHFTLNQLMQHETYRERFQHSSLSVIELNYALVQAYDFLHLYREHGCILQIGGNDQWFNILTGVELIRRVENNQAFALTTPLITTNSGHKMGKSESGAVWLDPALMSPYDYYQFWRNTEDPDVGRFLRLFTFLPLEQIVELERREGAEINRAKEVLAFEATRLTHGEDEARNAEQTARARFRGDGVDVGPSLVVGEPSFLTDLLVKSKLADSKSDAKRLIKGGGVRLGGQAQPADRLVELAELPTLLSAGKRKIRLERTGNG
jgi:tyrosyl-tRNA synthetase